MGALVERIWEEICRASPGAAGADPEARLRAELGRRWAEIVGPRLAARLSPGPTVEGRRLRVWADHSVALYEARATLRNLVERVRAAIPESPWTEVEFRLSQERKQGRPPPRRA